MTQITRGIRAALSHPLVYDAFQNIMGARRMRIDLASEFIRATPGTRILDIGCGTAEILPFLPEGVEYWGYDISPEYINAAQRRFGARGHFHCGLLDLEMVRKMPKFDVVMAIGVLHHLNDDEATRLYHLARGALADNGRIVTIDPCLAAGQNPIARFLIQRDRGQNVRTTEGYRSIAASSFDKIKGVLRHRKWIPYTHWIMECTA